MHSPEKPLSRLIRPHVRSGLILLAALAVLGQWTGCGASEMTLFLLGDTKKLNTCGGNTAQSVVVRVYQLRNTANFRKATGESFWQDDRKVLADELLERTEITVYPGDVRELVIKIAEQAKYVGVAADFCRPERDLWRQVYALEGGDSELIVELFEGSITLKTR